MEESRHRTLSRGFAILEAVAGAESAITITELATLTELDKSTVSRLVSSLQEIGYLNRLPDKRVVLSGKVLRLTNRFDAQLNLQQLTRPILASFRDEVNETVILTVRHGNFSVSIEQLDPDHAFRMVPHVGNTAPLDATAAGRAMLYALPAPEARRILADIQDEPIEHPEVRLDPSQLTAERQRAQRQGYVWIERTDDVERVASVVVDAVGSPIAAVSVYGPKYRMHERIAEIGGRCSTVAASISRLLRGDPTPEALARTL